MSLSNIKVNIDMHPDSRQKAIRQGDALIYHNDDGQLHRLDGPAYVADRYKAWWVDGKRHRLDGPAIVSSIVGSSVSEWWIDNKFLKTALGNNAEYPQFIYHVVMYLFNCDYSVADIFIKMLHENQELLR